MTTTTDGTLEFARQEEAALLERFRELTESRPDLTDEQKREYARIKRELGLSDAEVDDGLDALRNVRAYEKLIANKAKLRRQITRTAKALEEAEAKLEAERLRVIVPLEAKVREVHAMLAGLEQSARHTEQAPELMAKLKRLPQGRLMFDPALRVVGERNRDQDRAYYESRPTPRFSRVAIPPQDQTPRKILAGPMRG